MDETITVFPRGENPSKTAGRPIVPFKKVLDGILYILRNGCKWKELPREYGSGSNCHMRFQEWVQLGILKKLWIKLLKEHDHKKGIKWARQSPDSTSINHLWEGGDDRRKQSRHRQRQTGRKKAI